MIRRIQKNNDLVDYIKSYPKEVIGNVYELRYYIYGNDTQYITPTFVRKGDILEVAIPTSQLQTLGDGILYRKALYKEPETRFPDNYYNLEIIDNMDIWLYGSAEKPYKDLSSVDGYLYEISYDDIDYEYAEQYFRYRRVNIGSCSAVVKDNLVGRNYDWNYNNDAVFAVRTENTLGTASVPNLTKKSVDSEEYTDAYRILPFFLQDGINKSGLFAEINVAPAGNNYPSVPTVEKRESICNVMLVRYILDNFTNVTDAVNYIKKYVEIYNIMEDETHYLLKDKNRSVVLEVIDGEIKVIETNALTNFHIYGVEFNEDNTVYTPATANEGQYPSTNNIENYGQGLERWNLISTWDGSLDDLMKELYYSNAYKDAGWYSEFVGGNITVNTPSNNENFQNRIAVYQQKWEDRDRETGDVWHTVHSCIYDTDEKSVKISVQEDENIHLFLL